MRDLALGLFSVALAALVVRGAWRSRADLEAWLGQDPFATRRTLRAVCYVGAVLACALAWRIADRTPPTLSSGVQDVVVVVDVSRSMAVEDSPPTRLDRAVRLGTQVLDVGAGLRVGLVLFAGEAFTALPLTLDRSAPLPFLEALDTDLISRRGSDLARALRQAGDLYDPESERARAVLLLSDGEHAGDSLDDALETLRTEGVRVFAVGFGRAQGGPVPGDRAEPLSDAAGREVRSARRDDLLLEVARRTGGAYWREWDDRPSPAAIVTALRSGPPTPVEGTRGPLRAVLVLAVLLLMAEAWLALAAAPVGLSLGAGLPRIARRGAVALLAVALLGAADDDLVRRGDALLEAGEPQAALWLYRRVSEDQDAPEIQLRMGNAHYALEELDRAAAYYLGVLRAAPAPPPEIRFAAHFNLGNALAGMERFAEARDAFFSALIERPGDREAQFNYEWVLERVAEAEDESGEADPDESEQSDAQPGGEGREGGQREMEAAEAERWLRSLEDQMGDSLRRQIERELEARGEPSPPPGGQAW